MEINWIEYDGTQHPLAWVIIEAMSLTGIEKFGDFDGRKLSVELKVNGVEADFVGAMDFLKSQLSEMHKNSMKDGAVQAKQRLAERLERLLEID